MDLYEHRILIVDDEPALQKMVSDFLYKEGYRQVAAAGSCREARGAFEDRKSVV